MIEKIKKLLRPQKPHFYDIDGFHFDLGEWATLDKYQKEYPMYDRFVPYLGKLADMKMETMSSKGWIIDIGANIGDTTAGLIRHTHADIICVEPTKLYYEMLQKNVASMGEAYAKRIHCVQAYIAESNTEQYTSHLYTSTAVKVKVEEGGGAVEAPTLTIPDLLQLEKVDLNDVAVVKVDTDGYDSECILSFGDMLKTASPLLFWENEIDKTEQLQKYINMAHFLADHDYETFFVFDNFGNFLAEVDEAGLESINYYLDRIARGKSTRSFYYVDVLAAKNEGVEHCRSAVEQYLSMY